MSKRPIYLLILAIGLALPVAACGGSEIEAEDSSDTTNQTTTSTDATEADQAPATTEIDQTTAATATASDTVTFTAEVWADNWFALYANGELVGEDSVSITTERSFNAEIISFEASYPLTIALEAKDYIETDSGLEYIGEANQQMGDGGIIAQITDETTGEVVAVTSSAWAALVVHQAPLNAGCVDDVGPRRHLRVPDHRYPFRLDQSRIRRQCLDKRDGMEFRRRRSEGWLRRDRLGFVSAVHLGHRPGGGQHRAVALDRRRPLSTSLGA